MNKHIVLKTHVGDKNIENYARCQAFKIAYFNDEMELF